MNTQKNAKCEGGRGMVLLFIQIQIQCKMHSNFNEKWNCLIRYKE